MKIEIEGPPQPAMRPKVNKGKFYDPQCDEKKAFGWHVKSKLPRFFTAISNPVILELEFHMSIPTSLSKKKKSRLALTFHQKKPDLSNLIKFVEDALNGIVWKDDNAIAKVKAKKIYSENPKTILNVHFMK
jgi:Holliday junction resolvase RusA-like endonuclease